MSCGLSSVHMPFAIVVDMEGTVNRLSMNGLIRCALAGTLVSASFLSTAVASQRDQAAKCQPVGPLVGMPGLAEASGIAVSRRTPGRLWAHNDGEPVLFSLNEQGAVTGRVQLTGAKLEDFEAIAVGPCGTASCLYIGDIGDNEGKRKRITVYRMSEPEAASGSAAVSEAFHATYPDGAHDAEALLIGGDGRLYVVTKGDTGPIAIYRFPAALRSGASVVLEPVGAPLAKKPAAESRVTDGAVSPDGQTAVLRTRSSLVVYRSAELLAGQWRETSRIDLTSLKEPQGEGVAIGAGGTIYVAGEGGGKAQPGTFARFTCASAS